MVRVDVGCWRSGLHTVDFCPEETRVDGVGWYRRLMEEDEKRATKSASRTS